MTNYMFAPSPSFGLGEHSFTTWADAFTADELQRIVELGDSLIPETGVIGDNEVDKDYRSSKVAWIHCTGAVQWIFDRLAYIARHLNGKFYDYDLYGFCEGIQYTVYSGESEDHYDWHQDCGVNTDTPRKLSIVLQLSDPASYEGGELQIRNAKVPSAVEKSAGLAVAFPSFMLHRVTPVTSGTRRTLVAWITGPRFK